MTEDEESNLWERLQTVTVFEKASLNESEKWSIPKRHVKVFSQSSLLIESLIEYICALIEKDPAKQKNLYLTICQKLYELQLIDKSYMVDDFDFIRNNYQKELYRLVNVAQSVSPVIQRYHVPAPAVSSKNIGRCNQLFEWSRYFNEYHELEFIARGGFGEVVKVQNKLDAGIYAIKKICLRYCSLNGFIRGLAEVQMLAKLNHPNIVSYKAAWLEPLRRFRSVPKKSRNALCDVEKSELRKEKDSSDIIFADPDQSKTSGKASKECESNSSSDSLPELTDDDSHIVIESNTKDVFDYEVSYMRERSQPSHECGQDWAVLFIQMQLCHQTLRQWLDARNTRTNLPINISESFFIFSQIVKGVEFIHSKGIVHHDIKPNNIFISNDGKEVQVGDFGLSCCLLHDACPDTSAINVFSSPNCPVSITHQPGEIGTKLYAAPEQLNGICDFKSDLYSLGLILFELIYSFRTSMERIEKINNLRETTTVPFDLETEFPQVARLIKRLVSHDTNTRPTATELSEELSKMNEPEKYRNDETHLTIRKLQQELLRKNEEIAFLKKQILSLQTRNER